MNENDRRFLQGWGDELSPTLDENYELVTGMARVPVCVACPMAQWYKLEHPPSKPSEEPRQATLECFCTAYRGVMYDGRRVVTACDARLDALKSESGDLE
ncbi:MAG: hypothetical protein ABS86_00340 [Sphingobium sp. SCN 64-10]|nr:MAG: hypothetical protein ABS86_00340 [Sphingobium sp. SCN 64-10]